LYNQNNFEKRASGMTFAALAQPPWADSGNSPSTNLVTIGRNQERIPRHWKALGRISGFFGIVIALTFALNAMITAGLRRIKTSEFGASNQIMQGKVNAEIIITGSSRAAFHYDPRTLQAITGRTAFNLGRNGSQTDVQVAVLKAYLEHNQKPDLVIHNLDAYSFVTTREVYDLPKYIPYLSDQELYGSLRKINPQLWKSRYLPLYGYVVEDMNFSWTLGVKGFFGWSPREDSFLGFSPRSKKWTDEFQRYKAENPNGVRFEIEPEGVRVLEELVRVCRRNGIQLVFVYSPEYAEMQSLTKNRQEIFARFHELARRFDVPLWDYSAWKYVADQNYFYNSQHLNANGAAIFSADVAERLKEYFVARSPAASDLQASSRLTPQAGKARLWGGAALSALR
jgi:hypothetical protein